MSNAYTLSNVRQCYGERCVVDIDSLEVHAGKILGIVGPSGAGKSTLLRLLNFLEMPSNGDVTFRGESATSDLPLSVKREVTTVFQLSLIHISEPTRPRRQSRMASWA